jgi:hypothetical protein
MSDKWWDIPDDEFDELFRQAADNNLDYQEGAWQAMQQKLDKSNRKPRWAYWLGAGLLFVLITSSYLFFNENKESTLSEKNKEIAASKNKKPAEFEEKTTQKSDLVARTEKIEIPDTKPVETKSSTKLSEKSISKPIPTEPLTKSIYSTKQEQKPADELTYNNENKQSVKAVESNRTKPSAEASHKNSLNPSYPKREEYMLKSQEGNKPLTTFRDANTSAKTLFTEPWMVEECIPSATAKTQLSYLNAKTLKANKVTFVEPILPQVEEPEAEIAIKKENVERPKWGVRAVISPDLNSVESFSPSALGNTFGLIVEYEFARRWRLNTGALYTAKFYNANVQSYHAWSEAWKNWQVLPTDIVADCRIIDIPLNIRYDAWRTPKYDFFFSTGLTSYIMLNEKYDYIYDQPATTPKGREVSNSGNYWAGMLNFSLGYERQISKNFTLQAEPYLKVPLSQVGIGKVNLYGTGLLFSIKYQLK